MARTPKHPHESGGSNDTPRRAENDPADALRRAAEYGIDLSLLEANLALTPSQRIEKLIGWVEVATELRRGVAQRLTVAEPDRRIR